MRSRPFCFPSPYVQNPDDELHHLLSATEQEIHNPWPEIADIHDLRLAWSNPLIRLWYLPITNMYRYGEDLKAGRASLVMNMAFKHERLHLMLDFSPLKELARFWLANIYDALRDLFYLSIAPEEPSYEKIAEIWRAFSAFHEILGRIFEQLYLSEELITTALTFSLAEGDPYEQKRLRELEELEKTWVKVHGDDFQRLYGGFKKATNLALYNQENINFWTILARLLIFLQGVRGDFKEFRWVDQEVIDHRERCQKLVDYVSQMESADQLLKWLTEEVSADELKAWQRILEEETRIITESFSESHFFVKGLVRERKFKKGEKPEVWAKKIQESYWNWAGYPGTSWKYPTHFLFHPERAGERWFIRPWEFTKMKLPMSVLMLFDSYRQQLYQGVGFVCPFVSISPADGTVRCSCAESGAEESKLVNAGLKRLTRWALEGRLGDGKWRDLPYPCFAKSSN